MSPLLTSAAWMAAHLLSGVPPPPDGTQPPPEITRDPRRSEGAVAQDMKALEGQPGATPALHQVTVPAGPKHASLEGKPGPSPAMGPATAVVKVLVLSDFQCPVCRRVVEPLKEVVRSSGGKVQVVFLHNALTQHSQAGLAALAGIAAFRQGKFWAYHDLLFKDQSRLDRASLVAHARALRLDVARFERDLDDPEASAQVTYERSLAKALDAQGTPGFFVNGKKLVGWGSYGGFKAMVDRALRDAEAVSGAKRPGDVARLATQQSGAEGQKLVELLWGPQ
jgi:protein-disulfide isomerase